MEKAYLHQEHPIWDTSTSVVLSSDWSAAPWEILTRFVDALLGFSFCSFASSSFCWLVETASRANPQMSHLLVVCFRRFARFGLARAERSANLDGIYLTSLIHGFDLCVPFERFLLR